MFDVKKGEGMKASGLGQPFVARVETVCEEKKMKRIIFPVLFGILIAGWAADGQTTSAGHSTAPQDVLGKTWEWIETITPVEKITVTNPERYTIRLEENGKLQARFDCNRGGGDYKISEGKLSFGPMMSTRAACPPDSLDGPYMRDLQRVVSFFIQDGNLYLELPLDSGTMRFRADP
jgi:heat shock protein HslJ